MRWQGIEELKEFIERDRCHGHGYEVRVEDGKVVAWWVTYLDNGQGTYFHVHVYYECCQKGEKLVVNGYTTKELGEIFDKLRKECGRDFRCEECNEEACEIAGDLEYLSMLDQYLQYLEENMPVPVVERVEETLEHAGR